MSIEASKPLTAKQEKFLAALLQGATIKQAASATGVSERTGYDWAALPAIKQSLHEAARTATYTALRALQWAAPQAVETLQEQLTAEQPSAVRVTAASKVLDLVIQLAKMDGITNRLDALEALLEAQRQRDEQQQAQSASGWRPPLPPRSLGRR